ncbi:transcription termination factor NusA [Phosphitispora fastidiosa]|uniref:transcription termination factor NusA n=1 Tax=Phosphitispora fastidiosa TaxID=2837202 RepID=UPI001E500F61|nr:transcription termination factor NusA [Phosphitispora fastidiosa]MBU7008319.1 N utilization substance protein A [Phosphitispora fastidiosa]
MNTEFMEALAELEKEKGISMDVLLEALEAALISAYKRNFGSLQNVSVDINRETGAIKVYARKTVVEEVEDDRTEISIGEARQKDPRYELEDIVEVEVTPRDFGRIAAQTAKQVVVQRIREAERGIIFEEFSSREGDIVTGIVQRQDQKNVYIDLGKTEATLGPSEQIPGEEYRYGDRIKTYIVEVKKTTKGPQIMVSRTHPGLLKRLFELEVPEIHDGIVELKSVAREAGARSKIAVFSRDENVDPVGACVGPKGMRVQTIVSELKGEKIDIVKWNQDQSKYVANSLSPAKVVDVRIFEEDKVARVVVPDYQLSLAIGKEGQNARLAAKLTGWKIDIKNETQMEELMQSEEYFDEQDDEYIEDEEWVEGDYSDAGEDGDWDESAEYSEEYEEEYDDEDAEYSEDYYEEYDEGHAADNDPGQDSPQDSNEDEAGYDDDTVNDDLEDSTEGSGGEYEANGIGENDYEDNAESEEYDSGDEPETENASMGDEAEEYGIRPEGDSPEGAPDKDDKKKKKTKKKAKPQQQPRGKRKKLSLEELSEYLDELEDESEK